MAPRSASYQMADRLLSGRLAELLAEYRGAGLSWDDIGRRLYAEGGVVASGDTLAGWARQLGIEPDTATPQAVAQ